MPFMRTYRGVRLSGLRPSLFNPHAWGGGGGGGRLHDDHGRLGGPLEVATNQEDEAQHWELTVSNQNKEGHTVRGFGGHEGSKGGSSLSLADLFHT
eukprot:scaffold3625_cov154-Pinguiococcus_pyrenoidosus.AAC.2